MKKFLLLLIIFNIITTSSLLNAQNNAPSIFINGVPVSIRLALQDGVLYGNVTDLIREIGITYIYNPNTKQHIVNNALFDSSYVVASQNQTYLYLKAAVMAAGATKAEFNKAKYAIIIELPMGQIVGSLSWPGTQGANQPLPGCPVYLTDSYGATVKQATTDKQGKFFIGNIKPGKYILQTTVNVGIHIPLTSGNKTWAIPINIEGNKQYTIDLDNNNDAAKNK